MATQHSTRGGFGSRYKFNGKELDKDTGWYYYGARYYDPSVSNWLSVDPLAAKYPSVSPYNYTLNNPINLVDPDGRSVDDPPVKKPKEVVVLNRKLSKPEVSSVYFNPESYLGKEQTKGSQTIESKMRIVNDVYTLQNDGSYDKTATRVYTWSETTEISSKFEVTSHATTTYTEGPSFNNQTKTINSSCYDIDGASLNALLVDFVIDKTKEFNQPLAVTAHQTDIKQGQLMVATTGFIRTNPAATIIIGIVAFASSGSISKMHKASEYVIYLNPLHPPK